MTETERLNDLLGRELGRNPYGEPIFVWSWSEDLMWPAYKTGKMTTKAVSAPIIGTDQVETVEMTVPEYRQDRMCARLKDQWVITKWNPPESLERWQSTFPGADWPARGYRIHTNASLPRFPGGPTLPNTGDTEFFIQTMREQRSMSFEDRLADMQRAADMKDLVERNALEDELRDMVPAFVNGRPGKRGGYVSTPFSKQDSTT